MKITTKDNFSKKLPSGPVLSPNPLQVPVVTLAGFGLPIKIQAEKGGDPDIDEAELQQMADQMLASVAQDLSQQIELALETALKSSVWSWPGGSRDIYDTGRLAKSGKVTVSADGIDVVYAAPYAQIVHDGGYIHPYGNMNARPVYLPGRPWIRSVLYGEGPVPQFNFEGFFKSKFG